MIFGRPRRGGQPGPTGAAKAHPCPSSFSRRTITSALASARRRVDAQRDALFARAGVPADGSWLPKPFSEGADMADTSTGGEGEFGRSAT